MKILIQILGGNKERDAKTSRTLAIKRIAVHSCRNLFLKWIE